MAGQAISFDTNSLQTFNGNSGIFVDSITGLDDFPVKQAKQYPISHANRSAIPFVSYPSRNITITGTVQDTTIANLDATMDTFKSYFIAQDAHLDIAYRGTTVRFIATMNTSKITRPGGLLFAKFQIDFVCDNPFGQDTSTTTALNGTARTSSSYTDTVTFNGSAPFQLPIFTITYSAIAGGTNGIVIVGNSNTGQQVAIQRHWLTSDVLLIDPTNTTTPVMVNGLPVDFVGALPTFTPGSRTIYYYDTFTSRTMTENVVYTAFYL